MITLRLLPEARAELNAAAAWYASNAGKSVAERFVASYEATTALMSEHPRIGTPGIAGTRNLRLEGFPFSIVYRLHLDHAVLIAVAHQRRKPGFWLQRGI